MRNPRRIEEDARFESINRFRHQGKLRKSKPRKHLPDCKGKHTYRTKWAADDMRATLLKRSSAAYLRTYECPHCRFWHLTSQAPKKKP